MTALPHNIPSATNQWHNRLPAWIVASDAYQALRSGPRATLQAMANAGDVDDNGNIAMIYGGQPLADRIGISKATLWRHISALESAGFIVTLKRGGMVGTTQYANIYGVPSQHGALDQRRCSRRLQRMVPDSDGTLKPQVLRPGTDPELWPHQEPGEANHAQNLRLPPSQNATPTIPIPSPNGNDHGRGGGSRRGKRGSGSALRDLTTADLTDLPSLQARFREAQAAGLTGGSESDWIRWVAMAEHCRTHGKNPPALFASNVRGGRWLFVTQQDEDAAMRRIKGTRQPQAPQAPQAATLSTDAKVIRGVQKIAKTDAALLVALQKSDPSWSLERLESARAELREWGTR